MIFLTRKAGESLVIETPQGEIIIRVLPDDELAVDVPAGIEVASDTKTERPGNWLPARPGARRAHVA